MTVVDAPVRLGISLGMDENPMPVPCLEFAHPLLKQMRSGKYDECATMPLPRTVEAWEAEHRTARKRAWKAQAHGYRFDRLAKRDGYERDIYEINTSRESRQGRGMTRGYLEAPSFHDEVHPCELHGIHYYVVRAPDQTLVAYLWMYRAGDLALVSQVLGHADHEDFGIMHLLHRDALAAEGAIAPGVAVYNRFDSGGPGLRQFKSWIGYEPTAVEWLP